MTSVFAPLGFSNIRIWTGPIFNVQCELARQRSCIHAVPRGTLVVEDAMISRSSNYKEVLFGAAFGAGASLIDVAMHNTMGHRGFIEELLHPEPAMALYRALFVTLGIGLGVVLWQRNRRERDYRHLMRALAELRSCVAAPSVLIQTNLQLLLTKHIDTVPDQSGCDRSVRL